MQPMIHLSTQRCLHCSGPLTVHEAATGRVCAGPECRRKNMLHGAVLLEHERSEVRRRRARRHLEAQRSVEGRKGISGSEVVVVPALQLSLAPLPGQRHREFARRLIRLLRGLAREMQSEQPKGESTVRSERSADTAEVAANRFATVACSTCQGHCCRAGGNQAFIQLDTLRHYQRSRPGISNRAILRHYLRYLPSVTFQNSCLFHGADGCGLPRPMRSTTCNQHLCKDLRAALDSRKTEKQVATWIAALNDDHQIPVRTARFEEV